MDDRITRPTQTNPQPRKRKAKTGCRTCKLRKVKCDEGRPACRACVSTGRVCDGYGIWGGGGNRYEQRPVKKATVTPPKRTKPDPDLKLLLRRGPLKSFMQESTAEEQSHLDFFTNITATKLPGTFGIDLWNSLVLHVFIDEPAVLHAALALSSAHRRKVFDASSRNRAPELPDKQEEFMLRHYCKAIDHLRRKPLPSDEQSLRTALVTCLIFIYVEFLNGGYKRGCRHLDAGMKLLRELQIKLNRKAPACQLFTGPAARASQDTIDASLVDAFAKLRIQVEFSSQRSHSDSPTPLNDLPTLKFCSPHEARHYLDKIFEALSHLSTANQHVITTERKVACSEIVKIDQRLTHGALDSWLWTYDATVAGVHVIAGKESYEIFCYRTLRLYYTMADTMAATCLSPDQSAFDQHSSKFLSIIVQSNDILSNGASFNENNTPNSNYKFLDPYTSQSRVWPDVGWIPPLYYTAIKCRNHRLRTQAINLMSSVRRDENARDLRMALRVATEVVRLEESGFYEATNEYEETCRLSISDLYETAPLPQERRIDVVEMVLPGSALESLQVTCKTRSSGQWQVIRKTYDECSDTWA